MICRNCHRDAGNENYCPYCGAPMKRQYCPRCGVPLPPDGSACYSCGWTEKRTVSSSRYEEAPEVSSADRGLIAGKQRGADVHAETGAPKRTVAQTLMSLISGIAVLAAIGVTVYMMLMGNMFSAEGTALDPLTMTPAEGGSFGLVTNYTDIYNFFTGGILDMFSEFDPSNISAIVEPVCRILLVGTYLLAAVVVAIAAVIAVLRFIVGMVRGRNFSMAGFAAVTFGAVGMMWFTGRIGYYGDFVGEGSGTFLCMILAAAALGVCLLQNLVFAGRRLAKLGSILKLLTNAGICACAAICFLMFPFGISEGYSGKGSEVLGVALDLAASVFGEGEGPDVTVSIFGIVYMAALLILTVKYVFTLSFFTGKTASRLAGTFKFDGYKDKGFVFRSLLFLLGAALYAAAGIMYLSSCSAKPSTAFVAFCVSAAVLFVLSIINRMCLNRDQI